MTSFVIFLALVAAVIMYAVGIYNSLINLRNRVKNAFAQIDVQLTRRHDLIPNLVLAINDWTKSGRTDDPFPAWAAANQTHEPFKGKKVGRNAPCPCGSGRKYKQCCGTN